MPHQGVAPNLLRWHPDLQARGAQSLRRTTCVTDIRSVDACVGQNMPGAMLCNDEPRAGANNRARLTQNECDKTGVLTRQVCKRLRLRSDVDISESDPPPLSLGHHLLRDDQDRTGIRRYILSACRCNDELAQRIPARTAGKSRSGVRCSAPGFTGSFDTRQAEPGMGFVLFVDVDQH